MQNIRSLLSLAAASLVLLVGSSAEAAPCPFSGLYQYNPASPTANRCPAFTYVSTQQTPGPSNTCTPVFVCQNPQTGVNCEQTMTSPALSCSGGTNSGCRTCVYSATCGSQWSNTMSGVSCGSPNVCDGNGVCTRCRSNADCSETPTDNICTTNSCSSPNTSGASCSSSNITSSSARDCRQGASGFQGSPFNGYCRAPSGSAACVACISNADCSSPQVCNTSTNACVTPACTTNANCDDNNPCTDNVCTGGGTAAAVCSYPARTQSSGAQDCRVGSSPFSATPVNGYCRANGSTPACVQCRTNADCSGGQLCNGSFACQAPVCSTDAGCNDNNPCTTDTCNSPGTLSSSCSNVARTQSTGTFDCRRGASPYSGTPTDGYCRANGTTPACVQCRATADCAGGQYCRTTDYTCQTPVCSTTAQCQETPTDNICTTDVCNNPGSATSTCGRTNINTGTVKNCRRSTTGFQGTPVDGYCRVVTGTPSCVECLANSDCTGGQVCNTTTFACVTPLCTTNAQCQETPTDNPCTTDVCNNAGTATASCGRSNASAGTSCNAGAGRCCVTSSSTTCNGSGGVSLCSTGYCSSTTPTNTVALPSGASMACYTCNTGTGAWSENTQTLSTPAGCSAGQVCRAVSATAGSAVACTTATCLADATCNPSNPCQTGTCRTGAANRSTNGSCSTTFTNVANNTSCNTVARGYCASGTCTSATCDTGTCTDLNVCTTDVCNNPRTSSSSCAYTAFTNSSNPRDCTTGTNPIIVGASPNGYCRSNSGTAVCVACRSNADCTSPQYCNAAGSCTTPVCVTAANCTEGGVDNPCTINACTGTGASAACVYTPQSLSTRTCVRGSSPFAPGTPNGYCQLSSGSPVCVECLGDSDCASPTFCSNNICVPPACTTNADCNEGGTDNVCTTNTCVGVGAAAACQYTPVMSSSTSSMNCRRGAAPFSGTPDGFCINNAGSPSCIECLDNGDCGSGQCCSAGGCVACQACLSTSTTQSGTGGMCGNPPGAAGGNADSIFRYVPVGQASNDALQISYQLRAADVNFLLDTTLSMDGELSDLQAALTTGTIAQTCNSACTTASQGIMGAIRCCVSGAYFGVGTFDDYQVDPHGAPWPRRRTTYGSTVMSDDTAVSPYGDDGDRVFWNRTIITDPAGAAADRYTFVPRGTTSGNPSSSRYGNVFTGNVTGQVHLSQVVNGLSLGQGGDIPEAQLMALNLLTVSDTTNNGVYASATSNNDSTEYVVPAYARRTGNGTGVCDGTNYWGYPCFRQGSIPITVMMTDAPFHNGVQLPAGDAMATLFPVLGANYTTSGILYPNTLGSVSGPLYPPPSWTTVVSNLLSREMRVITVESSDGRACTSNMDCVSTPPGCLAFVSGYESKCISNVCRGPAYAHARALANATGSLDGYGAPYVNSISCNGTGMGASIVTQVAQLAQQERMDIWMDSVGAPVGMEVTFIPTTMSPVGGCQPITGSTFPQCLPGTQTNYTVRIRNNSLSPATPTEYNFTVRLRGGSTRILKEVPVRIMVGPGQASYPAMGSYTQMYSQFTGQSCVTNADCTAAGGGRFCVATATGTQECSRCAEGERPGWGRFTWTSVLPAGTRINFTVRTADTAAATATTTSVWTSDSICPSGETCISSTSDVDGDGHLDALGGAFDLTARLTAAGLTSGRRYLQVTVGMYSTPSRNATPELGALGLEMNCIGAE